MKIFRDHNEVNQLKIEACHIADISVQLSEDLKKFCADGSYACIAAPQIGINKRFFIMDGVIYINPYIEGISDRGAKTFEICENFPDKRIESKRYVWVEISCQINGETVIRRFTGEQAQYVQFCMDWLDHALGTVIEIIKQPTVRKEVEIGRNDPCTCGSGKKYKKCCGVA